jgi:hypothetical protein
VQEGSSVWFDFSRRPSGAIEVKASSGSSTPSKQQLTRDNSSQSILDEEVRSACLAPAQSHSDASYYTQVLGETEHRAGAPSPVRRSDSRDSRGSTPNGSAHYEKIVFEAVIEKVVGRIALPLQQILKRTCR